MGEFGRIDRVEHVWAHSEAMVMPADQFDGLVAGLDEPVDAPTLSRAVARHRLFVQA